MLLLDEAHERNEEMLEDLFMMSILLPAREHVLQIVLAGQQPKLEAKLRQPRCRQLDQRFTVTRLRPLLLLL